MSRSTANDACGEVLSGESGRLSAPKESNQQQNVIAERSDLEHINLTFWNMPKFGLMTHNNRAQVKCISLSLELEGDAGHLWQTPLNRRSPRTTDNTIFTTAMHDLFGMLSSWQPQGPLNLEIKISSPNGTTNELTLGSTRLVFFDDDLEKHWWHTLPEAPAITNLLIRAQDGRPWNPTTLDHLVSRLPNLEDFRYEKVPRVSTASQTHGTAMHHNPEFSGKRWANALRYHSSVQHQYFWQPMRAHYRATEFDPSRRPSADD
ncbi:hypothetical protein F5Y16DRAFT_393121 [Xylariaceae sp. FL0255]|nr:hypothetical protein F5Y16DRAFT_393121 [Xylariaceae sp. FL0255]